MGRKKKRTICLPVFLPLHNIRLQEFRHLIRVLHRRRNGRVRRRQAGLVSEPGANLLPGGGQDALVALEGDARGAEEVAVGRRGHCVLSYLERNGAVGLWRAEEVVRVELFGLLAQGWLGREKVGV